ncbi:MULTISPECIES: DUF1003 domain-containing protein [unclassified Bradyrhizobium]|uniref:DUF1003 domain-containing protein n=1 Tax=unclassified Bradyrhizobium TaxID=2631580 RepID=UPI0028EB88B7|nr:MULTISPECIES: DUF1003 domain-containing protein [unclassified Bradyrhizobium]
MAQELAPHPTPSPGLTPALERNIEALVDRRKRELTEATTQQKVAEAITRFTGAMTFVYLHLTVFGFWIVANLHLIPGVPAWDESFAEFAMIASVEAIFLSTFVLISQNRMAAEAHKRADPDLQISLLAEHELTQVETLLNQMAQRMGIEPDAKPELCDASKDIAQERVLDKIEEAQR